MDIDDISDEKRLDITQDFLDGDGFRTLDWAYDIGLHNIQQVLREELQLKEGRRDD